ncbi:F510_1955 family glycosylhydrolase [Streptomyces sp. ISL-100]|uniref:F510_1955 family glycosylhydrolase n=1 Tax=Streptomyces sp. ISL-100 TaxID=2819173 RepID=UPI001BE84730|nr:exo-alpha-sialidase [Streptomyces sp. ISL-100]MBT2396002.1 exo-alpha-sialidase [Streptomyces sp. ISL-100]
MNVRALAPALAAALLATGLAACTSDSDSDSADAALSLSHVHGLGVDPSDGRLYVATHDGLFTPNAEGEPQLVGDSRDDFMGFTVAGPKTFLASGHPASDDEPPHHGLIASTDAGKTWKTRSLKGEADFHALDVVHNTIYGYDSVSGKLRVSQDGTTWDNRADLRLLDLAVSPDDTNTVLATTEGGIARSTDGGRTFRAGAEPVMAFLSWPKKDALYGVDLNAKLNRSTDGGTSWKPVGQVPGGQSQALTAVSPSHIVVATQDGIYETRDAGKTFTKRLEVSS